MLKLVVLLLLVCEVELFRVQTGRSCTTNSNCYVGECCVNEDYMIASKRDLRRATSALRLPSYPYMQQGYCKAHSTRGQECGGLTTCGCAAGLQCQDTSSANSGARFAAGVYTCVSTVRTGRSCTTDSNCYVGECCVNENYMIASKRDLRRATSALRLPSYPYMQQGYCKAHSTRGQECGGFNTCGCAAGLQCQDTSSANSGARFAAGVYTCVSTVRYWS